MSKAEENAMQYCCTKCENNKRNCGMKPLSNGRNCIECGNYIAGYQQAEKNLTDKAKVSSGWDGFFYGQGYEQAEKDLELTWKDIKKLRKLISTKEINDGLFDKEDYQEILKHFKEKRNDTR